MKKQKREKTRLTIEKHLEQFLQQGERYEILWHAWRNNKRWLSQLLQTTLSSFPTYSKHDESHASTVMTNIEMILGAERIKKLSASDCFVILHTVYIHDIGMVITHADREQIVKNEKFLNMVDQLGEENDLVFRKAVKALKQTKYEYADNIDREEQMKQLYEDKLKVYYALLHLIANYRRTEHGDFSEKRLTEWTLDSGKLGAGFSMAGIPQRIFLHIAKCAGLHTQPFEKIMELPQEDDGYVGDYIHPRFAAVLLQLGDILDMDNDRFHPLTKECIGALPELSERHFEKHRSIRQLYIRPDIISIEADCKSQESLRLVRKECDLLKSILQEAGYNWMLICPRNLNGALPTVSSVKLSLNGVQIPEELVTTQFRISQEKAFSILEGSNVYSDRFVFLREFLQNAIDASKMQYWQEAVRSGKYQREELEKMSPDEMNRDFSTEKFPIKIEMEVVKRNEELQEFKITEEDKENTDKNWEYGVKVKITDFGTGIDKQSILDIARVGNSRKRERYIIQKMPEWLKPTAEFGIGLQSAFILTDMFKCNTFLRSNQGYEITFSSVKSTYYEGYINVTPIEQKDTYGANFGTCFEVFVPEKRKLQHELYPMTWDRKDFFDEDYEPSRSVRHAAELLAQMALYIDTQLGEQIFPVVLNIVPNQNVRVSLNETEKNRLKNLRCDYNKTDHEKEILDEIGRAFPEQKQRIQTFMEKREWFDLGSPWILHLDEIRRRKAESTDILIEKTENMIAILDCRDGGFYLWEKRLCILCTVNMKNFLRMEQREKESIDKHCEKVKRGIVLYYKGIFLEETTLPGLGNEMIELIDIKGKLPREFINLSRRGFTEKGKAHFNDNIYPQLEQSIYEMLQVISKRQEEALLQNIENVLEERKKLLDWMTTNEGKRSYKSLDDVVKSIAYREFQEELETYILIQFKEHIISLVMLAFFAQKEVYVPGVPRAYEEKNRECWSKLLKKVCEYANDIKQWFSDESILFHINTVGIVSLTDSESIGNTSKVINFTDVFSPENQYMIVSRRENKFAPWEQFLVPIWSQKERNKGTSFVEKQKKYLSLGDCEERDIVYQELQKMGENALKIGRVCGRNMAGTGTQISTENYSQQYFLKWMAKYIPTIAMFTSKDGNTRVNMIYGKVFPYLLVNMNYKELVLKRVLEYAKKYNMQRFSIPAWQNMEVLSCERLPYVLYFVKRGYASRESFKKVIFPFDGDMLQEIQDTVESKEAEARTKQLQELFNLYDIRKWMNILSAENENVFQDYIDKLEVKSEEKRKSVVLVCREFQEKWKEGDRSTERILTAVVHMYRQLVVEMLRKYIATKERKKVANIDEIDSVKKIWEKSMIYTLIDVLMDNYFESPIGALKKIAEEDGDTIAAWWDYIIRKKYVRDISVVVGQKEKYLEELEKEDSSIYQKNKRIVAYLAQKHGTTIREAYLWQYWEENIQDLFDVMISIELGDFYDPELLIRDIQYFKEEY